MSRRFVHKKNSFYWLLVWITVSVLLGSFLLHMLCLHIYYHMYSTSAPLKVRLHRQFSLYSLGFCILTGILEPSIQYTEVGKLMPLKGQVSSHIHKAVLYCSWWTGKCWWVNLSLTEFCNNIKTTSNCRWKFCPSVVVMCVLIMKLGCKTSTVHHKQSFIGHFMSRKFMA